MGNPLSQEMFAAFVDEVVLLNKEASLFSIGRGALRSLTKVRKIPSNIVKSVREGATETASRAVANPLKSIPAGWKELAPRKVTNAIRRDPRGGVISEGAKSLGRGGWTGTGKYTKYMPVGMKGMYAPFMAMDAHGVYEASKRPPSATGEGGLAETGLGATLGTAGMIAGGRRFLPSMALYALGSGAGGGLGRIVDRLRGGADLPTAAMAPSPTEAAEQLGNIQRYYG